MEICRAGIAGGIEPGIGGMRRGWWQRGEHADANPCAHSDPVAHAKSVADTDSFTLSVAVAHSNTDADSNSNSNADAFSGLQEAVGIDWQPAF
jgi:hypothetical protein